MSRFTVSPERHPVLSFEGPGQDLVFLEKVDMKQTRNRNAKYGDPHWDATTYPNHKIVHITPFGDGTGEFHAFYYAAARPDQDKYNWEYKSADIGGTKFDVVERTYVIKRADFEQEKSEWVVGTEMSRLPTTNEQGTEFAFPTGYILAETECGRIDEVMDGLFVAVKNTYIKRVVTSSNNFDEQFGGNLHSVERLYHKGEEVTAYVSQMKWAELTGSVYAGTPDSNIFEITSTPVAGDILSVELTEVDVEMIEFVAGSLPATIAETVLMIVAAYSASTTLTVIPVDGETDQISFTRKDVGLNSTVWFTEGDFGSFIDEVAGIDARPSDIDVVVVYSGITVELPIVSVAGETASDLARRIRAEISAQTLLDVTGDGGFVRIERRGVAANTDDSTLSLSITVNSPGHADVLVDDDFSRSAEAVDNTIEDVFSFSSSPYWGLQVNGIVRSGRQLSDKWFLVSESASVPGFMMVSGRTYYDTVDFNWPNVLQNVPVHTWNRKDGGSDVIAFPVWKRNAYGGPCKATITETFHVAPVATGTILAMLPIEMDIITPIIQVRIPPCLHGASSTRITVGTEDPMYQQAFVDFNFVATNYTDWPETILVQSDIQPMRGGYLKRNVTLRRPE